MLRGDRPGARLSAQSAALIVKRCARSGNTTVSYRSAPVAYYARDVLSGPQPGPYSDADAERFARLALIDADVTLLVDEGEGSTIGALLRPARTAELDDQRQPPATALRSLSDGTRSGAEAASRGTPPGRARNLPAGTAG
jgi:hypothetical protein